MWLHKSLFFSLTHYTFCLLPLCVTDKYCWVGKCLIRQWSPYLNWSPKKNTTATINPFSNATFKIIQGIKRQLRHYFFRSMMASHKAGTKWIQKPHHWVVHWLSLAARNKHQRVEGLSVSRGQTLYFLLQLQSKDILNKYFNENDQGPPLVWWHSCHWYLLYQGAGHKNKYYSIDYRVITHYYWVLWLSLSSCRH